MEAKESKHIITASVRHITESYIKPKKELEEHQKKLIGLTTWDLALLSVRYIQCGLVYSHQTSDDVSSLLEELKDSLSIALIHFYPLAGQLVTQQSEDKSSISIFIDSTKGPGAKFIHADVELTISDLLSPTDVPDIVDSFFYPYRAVNHDGHHLPLLTIQVTQLLDGIFIGCSMNHLCADGTSYWHFFNSWSEIFMKKFSILDDISISRPPIHTRRSLDESELIVKLPFTQSNEFIRRYSVKPPPLRSIIFHFSSDSIRKIKSRANINTACCSINSTIMVSSLQAFSALVWRCIFRASRTPADKEVACDLLINNRRRLNPPLSDNYFGNCIDAVSAKTTAGELLGGTLRCAALMLNQAVSAHNDKVVRDKVACAKRIPFIVYEDDRDLKVVITGSQWFDVYGNEFGMGKPVTALSGDDSRRDKKIILTPGREGDGSVDMEICLMPQTMSALQKDEEFMAAIIGS